MPNGIAIASARERRAARQRERREARREIPDADREHAARQRAARREHAETEHDLPQAGQQPQRVRRVAIEHDREQRAGDAGRNVLLDRRVQHLVGKSAMLAARARDHLGAGEDHGERRHAGPQREIGERRCGRIGQIERLQRAGEQREHPGRRDRHRPVAAELRAARHLAADRRDVRQRALEVLHPVPILLYNAKYTGVQIVRVQIKAA